LGVTMAHPVIAVGADALERRYRLLLLAYPADYRRERGDEIVGTLLDAAQPGQVWPRPPEVADLLGSGLRRRLRIDQVSGLAAGMTLAAPLALALAAGLSAFLLVWFDLALGTPAEPRPSQLQIPLMPPAATLGAVVYAGWLLAALAWLPASPVTARTAAALATATTVGVLPVAALTPLHRPPLWTTLTLTALGVLTLAGTPSGHRSTPVWQRLLVPAGALVIAGGATGYLYLGDPLVDQWWQPYYGVAIVASGTVAAGVVAAVAAVALVQALRRRPVRPWLWAGLLLALPGGWLGPLELNPPVEWTPILYFYDLQFGRLAQMLVASCVIIAIMAWLRGTGSRAATRETGLSRELGLGRATAVVVGCGAGLAVIHGMMRATQLPRLVTDSVVLSVPDFVALVATLCWVAAALAWAVLPAQRPGGALRLAAVSAAALVGVAWPPVDWYLGGHALPSSAVLAVLGLVAVGGTVATGTTGARHWRAVLAGAVVTMIATAAVVFYNDGWQFDQWGFSAAATLVGTLMLVPLAGVALAGAAGARRRMPGSRLRLTAWWATVGLSASSIAAMTLPYLSSWGPVLMLVAAVAAAAAAGGTIVAWRAAGDPASEEAFRGYASANQARLLATAYLICGDRATADRLVRAVLARLFLAWRRLPDATAADTYARRALVHAAARTRTVGRGRSRPVASGDELEDRLRGLPVSQRAALVLTLHDGLAPAEVADALDCPVVEVPRLTGQALERCRS